ncbi:MAG TPA: MFS transporter [Dehalococcoidia bacterium]|nr:MFS transporter [Dehalococcoidia bacterium]
MQRWRSRPRSVSIAPPGDGVVPRASGGVTARAGSLYYGWVLVVTLAITETTSWGVLYYSFTVFIDPMHASFGWSRSAMTGAFALALLVSAAIGVPTGRWLDRHGPRLLMTAGSCLAALLVLAWAGVDSLPALYLVWAGIGVAMAGVLYEPAFVVVATWFRRRRGAALTVLTLIAGLASVIYIPLAGWLVANGGWRRALVLLALILALGTIAPHALILRRRPEDIGLAPDGGPASVPHDVQPGGAFAEPDLPERSLAARQAMRGATFWLLTAAFFLNGLGVSAMLVHLVPYLTDRGFSAGFAARIAGLVGIMALPGRLVLTPLGDRISRSLITCAIFVLQVVALLALLLVNGTAGVLIFVVLFGAGFGAVTPARAALVAQYYGPASYGAISGAMAFFLTGSRAVAPVAAALLYDATGTYRIAFWSLTAASAVAAVTVLLAERSATAPQRT